MALLPVCLFAQEKNDTASIDSIADYWDKVLELNEVVVVGHRTVLKQESDRIVYLTKNDAFTKGLNGIEVLDRIPRVTVEGLMTMAPFSENPEDARPYFRRLRELRDSLEGELGIGLPRLSMGMSGDYEVAVEEGATWVRLGTVLFGERPKTKRVAASEGDDGTTPCGDSDTYAGFGGLDSYSGEGPTAKVLD